MKKETETKKVGRDSFVGPVRVWTVARGGFSQVRGPVGSPSPGDIYYDEVGASRQMVKTVRDRKIDPIIEPPAGSISLPPTWNSKEVRRVGR